MDARNPNEKGIALVLSLFLMLAMSVLAGSLMFLSQTETYASMNYRLMSQARYGGESGIHKAANYLLNTYVAPGDPGDPIAAYDMTKSPVTLVANNNRVVLSAASGVNPNYPISGVQTAFQNAASGSLNAGNTAINYGAYATLVSMRQIQVYGQTAPVTVQTWQITANGTINGGARAAQVEVSAILERAVGPTFKYAAFAVDPGCGALGFSGGGSTDSFDSTIAGSALSPDQYGGDVGSNGNLNVAGTPTIINGTLSTPRTGVGDCSAGNVTAWTNNNATVSGGLVALPQSVPYTAPDPPNPLPPTTAVNLNSGCGDTGYGAIALPGTPTCSTAAGDVTLNPNGGVVSLGDVTLAGNNTLHLTAGTYNINSIAFTGNSTIVIDSGPVILNVAGLDSMGQYLATPVAFEGQMASNSTYDPTMLQILYGGTGTIQAAGGSDNAALIFAPNAHVNLTGDSSWFGAIIAATIDVSGGAAIHYDRQLRRSQFSLGPFVMSSFTWKKY